MRAALTSLIFLLALPFAVAAQWTVTAQAGVHADRLDPPQRLLTEGSSASMFSTEGEAPSIGMRVSNWVHPHFGVDAGLAISQNRSWQGAAPAPRPSFVKRTVFTSAAALWRPLAPDGRWHLQVGLGPAAIFHGGSGESLLARQTDFGAMGTAGVHVALGERLHLGVDVYNYRFASRFKETITRRGRIPVPSG